MTIRPRYLLILVDGSRGAFTAETPTPADFMTADAQLSTIIDLQELKEYDHGLWRQIPQGVLDTPDVESDICATVHVPPSFADPAHLTDGLAPLDLTMLAAQPAPSSVRAALHQSAVILRAFLALIPAKHRDPAFLDALLPVAAKSVTAIEEVAASLSEEPQKS